jgi:ParB/RepB/Spo0J family partition protein
LLDTRRGGKKFKLVGGRPSCPEVWNTITDVPLSLIDENPFNCRKYYEERDNRKLAESLSNFGLLSPIKVRSSGSRFQIVYGHRRVRAARLLKWETIRAELQDVMDEAMLNFSLIENMERKNLSDFETAMSFWRLNREFGKTFEEIGRIAGFSAAHICNFVRMTEMFDPDVMTDPAVLSDLQRISEHHARILLRIENVETRRRLLRMVVTDDLSVRDLQRIVQKFRVWFKTEDDVRRSPNPDDAEESIVRSLRDEAELPHRGDFIAFQKLHAKEFSLYSNLPPFERFEGTEAAEHEKDWFFSVGPKEKRTVKDVRIQFYSAVALATLSVDRKPDSDERGTVLFVNVDGGWKIVHEHWSDTRKERDLPGQILP